MSQPGRFFENLAAAQTVEALEALLP